MTTGPKADVVVPMIGHPALYRPLTALDQAHGPRTGRLVVVEDRRSAKGPLVPRLVLFDRDGTLVDDVPYNGDPELVTPRPGARFALDHLRSLGVAVGVITNQSGIGRGLLTARQVDAVNARVERLLGPFATFEVCPHAPAEGCDCRKPATGLVLAALDRLGVQPDQCAVVGDIGADVEAGLAVGARAILVPNGATCTDEIVDAPEVALDIRAAVQALSSGCALDGRNPRACPRGVT